MTSMNTTNSTVQTENVSLYQHIIDLEQALAIQSQIIAQQERMLQRTQDLLAASLVVTYSRKAADEYPVTFISDNAIEIFGYKSHEFITDVRFWASHIHPDDLSRVFADLNDVFAQEKFSHEYRFLHQDGTYRWVHDQLRLIRDAAGQPVEIVGSWQDITACKQTEAELRTFKALIENASDGIGIADQHGTILYANPAYQSMVGYGADLIGMSGFDLIVTEDQPVAAAALSTLAAQRAVTLDLWFQRKDGSTFPVATSMFTQATTDGQQVVGFVRDISEQRQREDELRLFQALVENAPDGIVIGNMEGKYVYANPAMQSMYGYGTDLIGMNGFEVLDEDPHVVESAFQRLRERGSVNFITTYRRANGSTFPIDTISYIINTTSGESRVITFVRDISEQQKMEAERLALQQQIIDAQRHSLRELSTPLIPISTTTVVMPLIGAIDTTRAQQILETLLEGVAAYQAETAIIDITGVQVVDTQVANALIRAAKAVRLLGARVLLTGIKPQIAQTLVHLGVSLDGIQTYSSLQSGVRTAIQQDRAA